MGVSIVVILIGIVIVGGLTIAIALVAFGLLTGTSSKPMPEPEDEDVSIQRQSILDKLERNEISKEEADAALNAIEKEGRAESPRSSGANVGCIIGILAAVIIGILLILGIIMTLMFGRTTRFNPAPVVPIESQIDPQILMEAKQPLSEPVDDESATKEPVTDKGEPETGSEEPAADEDNKAN